MFRTIGLFLLIASTALAQPPTIALPPTAEGTAGKFLRVPATTNGHTVRWFSPDSTLDIFPVELLRDTTTAVVVPQRSCSLFAYTALQDVPSELAECKIIVGGKPPDPPTPPDPPGPTPVPPVPIPNDYGIGAVAYQYAPKDASGASKYAAVFKASADFLFGKPSLKFITSSTDAHNSDPNRSVQAWMTQQYGLITCTDPATCAAWETWRTKVNEAFLAAQQKKQFTRQDWKNAFTEAAIALGAIR